MRIIEEFERDAARAEKVIDKLNVDPHGKRLPVAGYLTSLQIPLPSLNLFKLT